MEFKYGGIVTDINKLPIGTYFYVYNGCWNGFIGKNENGKYVKVIEKNTIYKLDKPHYLSIEIVKKDTTIKININRKRYIIIRKCDDAILTENGFTTKINNQNINMYENKDYPLQLIRSWNYNENDIKIVPIIEKISTL